MRFDVFLAASLLPALSTAASSHCFGPCAAKKMGQKQVQLDTVSLASTDSLKGSVDTQANSNEDKYCGTAGSKTNHCGCSTFTAVTVETEDERVLPDDVLKLSQAAAGANTEWIVPPTGRLIMSYKTAGFFATSDNNNLVVGSQDVADLTFDSWKYHSKKYFSKLQGRYVQYVNEAGSMPCDDPNASKASLANVDWTIGRVNKVDYKGASSSAQIGTKASDAGQTQDDTSGKTGAANSGQGKTTDSGKYRAANIVPDSSGRDNSGGSGHDGNDNDNDNNHYQNP